MGASGVELQRGTRIREYEILDIVGKGGMGAVYKARHVYLNKIRAIKFIHSTLAVDPDFVERFIREARILSELNHPNLVRLYEFGTLESNTFFMVLEFVHGESLLSRIRRKTRLSLDEAIPIIREAALGLDSAHQLGIVHRDISPDNLLLVRQPDGSELTKVIDFGIAKPLRETQQITTTTFFIGKPEYCSPEQTGMLQEGEEIDHRSDIYSLAVTFYHAISGKLPFYSPTPQGYLLKHATEQPQSILVHFSSGEIPNELDQFLRKALSKHRDDRFSTMKEFVVELNRVESILKQVQQTMALANPEANFQDFFQKGKESFDQLEWEEAIRWWKRAMVISNDPTVQQWIHAAEERTRIENETRMQIAKELDDCEIQLSQSKYDAAGRILDHVEPSITPAYRLADLQTRVATLREKITDRSSFNRQPPVLPPVQKKSSAAVWLIAIFTFFLVILVAAIGLWKWSESRKRSEVIDEIARLSDQHQFSRAHTKVEELQSLGASSDVIDQEESFIKSQEQQYAEGLLRDIQNAINSGNLADANLRLGELRDSGVRGYESQIATLETQIQSGGQKQPSTEDYMARSERSRSPLMQALYNNNVAEAQRLLQETADINAADANQFSILMYAAWRCGDMVPYILTRGANVNQVDNRGVTALHVACDVGQVDAASALIAAGANINARNSQGATPIIVAVIQGRSELVRLLIDAGADLTIQTPTGYDALRTAEYYNRHDIANMIRQAQSN